MPFTSITRPYKFIGSNQQINITFHPKYVQQVMNGTPLREELKYMDTLYFGLA
jgi:hypothetical protein